MKVATVHFHSIEIGSQEYGTTDEHMVSRVVADVELPGFQPRPISIDVKQTVGSTFDRQNIEVRVGAGGDGLDVTEMQRAVCGYYVDLCQGAALRVVGRPGPAIPIFQPGRFVSVTGMQLAHECSVSVPLAGRTDGGW